MKKLIFSLFLSFLVLGAMAQSDMLNALATAGVHPKSDTVTNTGTATLSLFAPGATGPTGTVSIHWEAVEISGTTAGTLSLYGSNDGTNYRSITSTTFTATDVASQGGIWIVTGSPVAYYRVTWTGVGTMSDKLTARLFKH